MKILVTGGLGFIGSHLTDKLVEQNHEVHVVDALKTGSDIKNMNSKAQYFLQDLCEEEKLEDLFKSNQYDQIYHLAAESHVDRSIKDAQPFINSNITGTYNLFKAIEKTQDKSKLRFLLFSTDELMGELTTGSFKEEDPCYPKNLYSMTKQAQEAIARSYYAMYGINIVTTRCSNIYGPRQFQEKFLPTIIRSLLQDKKIPVYGKGDQWREWTWVKDACEAAIFIMQNGQSNQIYHIGSGIEKQNIDVVNFVIKEMQKDSSFIEYVADRLGHDKRYSLCVDKVNKMGWKAQVDFEVGFKETIEWFIKNPR